jgi:anti-sigma factor RsiW
MTTHDDLPCFTDFALEEYVHGRLDPEVRSDVELHCAACEQCRNAIGLLHAESEFFKRTMRSAAHPAEAAEVGREHLALYLDGALEAEAVEALESRLLSDPRLMSSLCDLAAEVRETVAGLASGIQRSSEHLVLTGQIVRMPKRVAPPAVVVSKDLKFGGGYPG